VGSSTVIELHLIGYTEDAEHLVLDLDVDGEGRYQLRVEPDLLATLEAVREQRIASGRPVDARRVAPSPAPAPPRLAPRRVEATPSENGRVGEPAHEEAAPAPREPDETPSERDPAPATDGDAARTADEDGPPVDAPETSAAPAGPPRSKLSPAEIQGQLRSGRSVRAVAREAGADPAWIERWLAPILAERDRVLEDARKRRIDEPHARALGASVDRSLADRGVEPDAARWRVSRRDDGRWRITVRFDERGRPRSATWVLDPMQAHLRPQSPLATELASPRRRGRGRRR
jgi:hypothetical protein